MSALKDKSVHSVVSAYIRTKKTKSVHPPTLAYVRSRRENFQNAFLADSSVLKSNLTL
jgi:hypothetical protein